MDFEDIKEAYLFLRRHPDLLRSGLTNIEVDDRKYGKVYLIPKKKEMALYVYRAEKYVYLKNLPSGSIIWIISKNPSASYRCKVHSSLEILSHKQFLERYIKS